MTQLDRVARWESRMGVTVPTLFAVALAINLWCAFTRRLGFEEKQP